MLQERVRGFVEFYSHATAENGIAAVVPSSTLPEAASISLKFSSELFCFHDPSLLHLIARHSFLSMALFMANGSIMKLRLRMRKSFSLVRSMYPKGIPWGGAGDDFVVESTTRLLLTLRLLA
ncbi:hypothetical protein L1987_30777 [Smallanthus sonchifolius]|uniref:Uncharacterized protein n=1 Tax=Smallanthus sonchifolius TaxID=185202 RepID=A0ACB9I4C9_9ASTR|nr:hypothetical protein L1987_30777 [Smallanthus sonchifolius]